MNWDSWNINFHKPSVLIYSLYRKTIKYAGNQHFLCPNCHNGPILTQILYKKSIKDNKSNVTHRCETKTINYLSQKDIYQTFWRNFCIGLRKTRTGSSSMGSIFELPPSQWIFLCERANTEVYTVVEFGLVYWKKLCIVSFV